MIGWVIYDEAGYKRNKWFANELRDRLGSDCRLIISEYLDFGVDGGFFFKYMGEKMKLPAYAVQRCIYPVLSDTLETAGVRVFNSARVCRVCNDKRATLLLASSLGINCPKTVFADRAFKPKFEDFPCVLKAAGGHGGSQVIMVNSNEEYLKSAEDFDSRDILFQQIVDPGRDKRVYLLGGKVLACVERHSHRDFRSNFSLGGSAEPADVSDAELRAVRLINGELKPDFVGVDFIYKNGVPLLNEVEDIVGTRMLYELTDIDAVGEYAKYIKGTI